MEIDNGAFVSKPSIQQFLAFRKKDLLQIADILNISVSSSAAKEEIEANVYAKLVKKGLKKGGTIDFSLF